MINRFHIWSSSPRTVYHRLRPLLFGKCFNMNSPTDNINIETGISSPIKKIFIVSNGYSLRAFTVSKSSMGIRLRWFILQRLMQLRWWAAGSGAIHPAISSLPHNGALSLHLRQKDGPIDIHVAKYAPSHKRNVLLLFRGAISLKTLW